MQEYEQIKNLEMQTIELISKIRELEALLQAEEDKTSKQKKQIRILKEELAAEINVSKMKDLTIKNLKALLDAERASSNQ